ncbi:MAG TPA: hypothetical protein V6D08_11990 [Candidatus Obscuribacterales bacterium]
MQEMVNSSCLSTVLVSLCIGLAVSLPAASAAEQTDTYAPPKPIIRNFKQQSPLPGYKGAPASTARKGEIPGGESQLKRSAAWPEKRQGAAVSRPSSQAPVSAPGTTYGTTQPERQSAPKVRYRLGMPLQGSVVMNVPKTPADVTKYLKRMRKIIHDYERVAVDTLLGAGKINIDAASIEASRAQSLDVIQRIRATTPPAQLTVAHNQLADTMAVVGDFLQNPGGAQGGGLSALAQVQPLFARLHGSLDRYHTGVRNCIAYYGLSPDLDPFHGEDEDAKQRLSGAIDDMKGQLANPPAASSPLPGGSVAPGGPAAGLGGDLTQGLGGLDLSALQKLLGGVDLNSLGGGLGNLDPGALGGSGGGGLDFSKLGALDRLGNLDGNALGDLSGKELDTLKGLMGPAGSSNSGSPGLQLDPQTADMLQNMLKQLQGQ